MQGPSNILVILSNGRPAIRDLAQGSAAFRCWMDACPSYILGNDVCHRSSDRGERLKCRAAISGQSPELLELNTRHTNLRERSRPEGHRGSTSLLPWTGASVPPAISFWRSLDTLSITQRAVILRYAAGSITMQRSQASFSAPCFASWELPLFCSPPPIFSGVGMSRAGRTSRATQSGRDRLLDCRRTNQLSDADELSCTGFWGESRPRNHEIRSNHSRRSKQAVLSRTSVVRSCKRN